MQTLVSIQVCVPFHKSFSRLVRSTATHYDAVYHMVLLVAFSQGEWTKNVWGGCMILRREDLQGDIHGCVTKYKDGGGRLCLFAPHFEH